MNDERKTQLEGVRDIRERLLDYAQRVIRLYKSLPKTVVAQTIGKQLLRSGLSVGAQHREAYRAKSDADFISKMGGALGELDETDYWLELLARDDIVERRLLTPLTRETAELIAIFVASIKKVKARATK